LRWSWRLLRFLPGPPEPYPSSIRKNGTIHAALRDPPFPECCRALQLYFFPSFPGQPDLSDSDVPETELGVRKRACFFFLIFSRWPSSPHGLAPVPDLVDFFLFLRPHRKWVSSSPSFINFSSLRCPFPVPTFFYLLPLSRGPYVRTLCRLVPRESICFPWVSQPFNLLFGKHADGELSLS